MANAINGSSDKFTFRIVNSLGITETISFSGKHQALFEYDTTIATRHELLKGGKVKSAKHVNLEWEIDFSEYLAKGDAKQINKIKNAEMDGNKLYLVPHTDVPGRSFRVFIIEDKRKLGKHYGNQPNKDYVMFFENADTIDRHGWIDDDDIGVITQTCNESIKFII